MNHAEEQSLKKRVVKNSFLGFIATLINRIGGLLFTIIIARMLLPEGYGIYSIAFATIMVFFVFADLGINYSVIKIMAEAMAKEKKKVSAYYRYLLKLKFVLAGIMLISILVLAYPISMYLYNESRLLLPLIIASLFAFILSLEVFHSHLFYSAEKTEYVSFREAITQVLRVVLVFFVFVIFSPERQVEGVFILLTLVHAIMLVWVFHYLKKVVPKIFKKTKEKIDKKKVRTFVKFLAIASISVMFFSQIDSIMLGIFLPPEFVGLYQAAFSIVFGLAMIIVFPNQILLPIFTKINKHETEVVLNKSLRYIAMLAIPSSFGVFVMGRYFIKLLYSDAYLGATLPLSFLAFLILPLVFVEVFLSLFSAKNKPEIFAKLIVTVSALNIVLNFIFIKLFLRISPLWATAGAGIATLLSWIIYFIVSLRISRKTFNMKVSLRYTIRPLIASVVMTAILFYFMSVIGDIGVVIGLFLVAFGGAIYFATLFLIGGLKREDWEVAKIILKRK